MWRNCRVGRGLRGVRGLRVITTRRRTPSRKASVLAATDVVWKYEDGRHANVNFAVSASVHTSLHSWWCTAYRRHVLEKAVSVPSAATRTWQHLSSGGLVPACIVLVLHVTHRPFPVVFAAYNVPPQDTAFAKALFTSHCIQHRLVCVK